MRKIFICVALCVSMYSFSQTLPHSLKVFVDCSNGGDCYYEYIRQELTIVDFVRDRHDADLDIIVIVQYNSVGSTQLDLHFIGSREFASLSDTIQYSIPPAATEAIKRNKFVTNLKIGLVPFLNRTAQRDKLIISFSNETDKKADTVKDPWNAWVFQLSSYLNLNGSENYSTTSANFNIDVNKETKKYKTRIYFNTNERYEKYRDAGTLYRYKFLSHHAGFDHSIKLNEHWAAGALGSWSNSLYSNYKSQWEVGPKIEYSIFQFKDYNTKRWVVDYMAGPVHNSYYDTTIYLKTKELLFLQIISSNFSFIQPWGSVNAGVYWNNYLNDFKKNNLSLNGGIELNIAKGLNFTIYVNYSFVHDQINVRKGDIDINQLLVRNKELLSSYNYYLNTGLTYRFGSKFNNTVNPVFR